MKAPALLQMITLRGHTFLPGPLGPHSVVVDLGANMGDFSRLIRKRYGCRVVAVEANPNLIPHVRAAEGVEVINAAAFGVAGELELHLSNNSEASTTLGAQAGVTNGTVVRIPGLTLETILKQHGITHVDLLKVDIEGAEVGVIMKSPDNIIRSIDQITLEFHDFCGLTTPQEVRDVIARLDQLGFSGYRFGNDNMNWLFAKRELKGVSGLSRWYATQVVRRARNVFHWGRGLVGANNFGFNDEPLPPTKAS